MTSKDILCNEIYEEFKRNYGYFSNSILGAMSILKGDIFTNLKSLKMLQDSDIPDDISETTNAIAKVVDSAINNINATLWSMSQDLTTILKKDYTIRSELENIGINPESFNIESNFNKNISGLIGNYANYLLSTLPISDLSINISRLEQTVPTILVNKIFKMKTHITTICGAIQLPSDIELENMLSSVALNLNSEFNLNSQIIYSKFNFNVKKIDYIHKMVNLGRQIISISKRLKTENLGE